MGRVRAARAGSGCTRTRVAISARRRTCFPGNCAERYRATRPSHVPPAHRSALCAFIVPSPKQDDLRRDGRFAMHSFPCEDNEDAFYVTGRAGVVEEEAVRQSLAQQFVDERSQIGVPPPPAQISCSSFIYLAAWSPRPLAMAIRTRSTSSGATVKIVSWSFFGQRPTLRTRSQPTQEDRSSAAAPGGC